MADFLTAFSLKRSFSMVLLTGLMAATLAGCAATTARNDANGDPMLVSDPLEPVNRVTFSLNEALDKFIFNPIVTAYRAVVPKVGRDAVHGVLDNLKSPVYLANEVLQGDLEGAGTVVKRFAINTVIGVGGAVDMAAKGGIKYQPEDFGQTLAKWGVGSGPYIVWPILGPSTARDSVGLVGDIAMDPLYWYATNTDREWINYTRTGLTVLDNKDRFRDSLDDLRRNSGDFYAALRSVYMQRRNALVNDSDPSKAALPDIE